MVARICERVASVTATCLCDLNYHRIRLSRADIFTITFDRTRRTRIHPILEWSIDVECWGKFVIPSNFTFSRFFRGRGSKTTDREGATNYSQGALWKLMPNGREIIVGIIGLSKFMKYERFAPVKCLIACAKRLPFLWIGLSSLFSVIVSYFLTRSYI